MTKPSPRLKKWDGGFIRAQNRVDLSYDKLFAAIDLTYGKQKDIMILR